jgi:hypothetical protein
MTPGLAELPARRRCRGRAVDHAQGAEQGAVRQAYRVAAVALDAELFAQATSA